MYKRNAQGWSKHFDFIILDEIMLMVSFLLGMVIRHGSVILERGDYRTLMVVLFLVGAIFQHYAEGLLILALCLLSRYYSHLKNEK